MPGTGVSTMQTRSVFSSLRAWAGIPGVVAAVLLAGPTAFGQSTFTWDVVSGTSGPQDGAGTWNSSNTNWWNGSTNVAWTAGNIATFGAGGAPGTVTVSGSVNAGGLTFGSLASGTYTLSSGTIGLTAGGTIAMSRSTTINSTLSGSNITLLWTSGTGTVGTLGSASNSLTGTFSLRASGSTSPMTVSGIAPNRFGAATIDVGNFVTWQPNDATYSNNIVISGSGDPGAVRGAIRIGGGTNPTLTGTVTLAGNASIIGNSSAPVIFAGPFNETDGGAKNLELGNNGFTYLRGASTYTGVTAINGPVVLDNGDNRLPVSTSVSVGTQPLGGAGKLVLGGTVSGAMSQTLAGLTANSNARSVAGGASGTSTLNLAIASGTNTYIGSFGGTAANENNLALTKSGVGTLSLTGTSYTYTGDTTISSGRLALGASAAALSSSGVIRVGSVGSSDAVFDLSARSGTYTFGPNQTVAGIGTINFGSGRTVASQGIWAPGNSIGSNAVTGNLSLSGTSQFELGTPGSSQSSPGVSDFTAVSGTLTLGGSLTLLDNAGADGNGSMGAGSYRIFTYGNTVSGSFTSITNPLAANTRATLVTAGSGTAAGSGVFVNVYNLASAGVLSGTINLGTVLAGTPLSQPLSIVNTAPAGSYSEKLDAAFGTLTGGASGTGSVSLLAAGGTNASSMVVGLSSLTAGTKTGSAEVSFASNGAGTSGYGAQALSPQTVNLTATVLDPAVASFASGSTTTSLLLDFGTVQQNASVSPLGFSLFNLMQTNGFTADLALLSIDETNPSGPFSTNLSLFNTLAAGTSNAYTASFSTATTGLFQNVYTLTFKSSEGGTAYASDTPQTLTLTVQGVIGVPEPGTAITAAIGIACIGWSAWRRRRRS